MSYSEVSPETIGLHANVTSEKGTMNMIRLGHTVQYKTYPHRSGIQHDVVTGHTGLLELSRLDFISLLGLFGFLGFLCAVQVNGIFIKGESKLQV